jgi:hypothetical protein
VECLQSGAASAGSIAAVVDDQEPLVDQQRELIEDLVALRVAPARDGLGGVDIATNLGTAAAGSALPTNSHLLNTHRYQLA